MYINNIWLAFLEIIYIVPCDWNILRILVALVMFLPETSVRILIIIWYRNDISFAVSVLVRRPPHTFQGVPHGCLVRQEHDFLFILRHVVGDSVLQLYELLSDLFGQFPAQRFIPDADPQLVDVLTIIFQNAHHGRVVHVLQRFQIIAQIDRCLLALCKFFLHIKKGSGRCCPGDGIIYLYECRHDLKQILFPVPFHVRHLPWHTCC